MSKAICPHCGLEFQSQQEGAGLRCPACQQLVSAGGESRPILPHTSRPALPPPLPKNARSRSLAGIILIVVVLGLVLAGVGGYAYVKKRAADKAKAMAEIKGMRGDLEKVISQASDEEGMPKEINVKFDTSSNTPATGPERMRLLIQQFLNDMIEFRNGYLKKLDEAGLERLIDANRVAADKTGNESREMIKHLKQIVLDHQAKYHSIIADFPQRVEKGGFTAQEQASIIAGFHAQQAKSGPLGREIWELEVSAIADYEALITHILDNRQYWEVEEGQYIFERDEDLERFNQIVEKMQETVKRQEKLQAEAQKASMKTFDDITK